MTNNYKPPMNQLLYSIDQDTIKLAAIELLDKLMERCTIHLATELTGITRATFYKWLNEDIPLESMQMHTAAWFIMCCELDPRIIMLLERPPTKYQRKAKALTHPEGAN